jgi:hypothetical protein
MTSLHNQIVRLRRALAAIDLWGETQGQYHPIAAAEVANARRALNALEGLLVEAGGPSPATTLATVINDLRTAGRQPATGAAK